MFDSLLENDFDVILDENVDYFQVLSKPYQDGGDNGFDQ